jgi:hypothetical protein
MLAEQEVTAWQQTDAAGAPDAAPPKFAQFGTSDSPSADVFAFYSNWGSFVTCKEFAWADKYNPAAAPNRQVCCRIGRSSLLYLLYGILAAAFAAAIIILHSMDAFLSSLLDFSMPHSRAVC